MATLEAISEQNVSAFRAVRLRALLDSPSAFGSTYAREAEFDDAKWLERAANMSGQRGAGFLALDGNEPCGIIGALLNGDEPHIAQVVSMWVAPTYRRGGIASALIGAIGSWSQAHGVHTLRLMVTSCNQGAIEFYKRCGFAMTGNTEPYPHDPALIEYEMARSVQIAELQPNTSPPGD